MCLEFDLGEATRQHAIKMAMGSSKYGKIFTDYTQFRTVQSWKKLKLTIGYNASGNVYKMIFTIIRIISDVTYGWYTGGTLRLYCSHIQSMFHVEEPVTMGDVLIPVVMMKTVETEYLGYPRESFSN